MQSCCRPSTEGSFRETERFVEGCQKNNNHLTSICHDKLKIGSLTNLLASRERKIDQLTKCVGDLSIKLAIDRTTDSDRDRDIREMEKVEHKV